MPALLYASDAVYCGVVCHTSYATPISWAGHLEMPEKPPEGSHVDSQTFILNSVLYLKSL